MKFTKKSLKGICSELGFEKSLSLYIVEAVKHCIDNGISHVDLVATKDIYKTLEFKTGKTSCSIEHEFVRGIKNAYNKLVFTKVLNYDQRPTVKKLFILLLIKYDK